MELVPEALSTLSDSRINSLPITAVNCKNGKYDAIVYFDGSDFEEKEALENYNKAKDPDFIVKESAEVLVDLMSQKELLTADNVH